MTSAPILALPGSEEHFVMYSDALRSGLGCVLMQRDQVIAYAFHQLKPHESELLDPRSKASGSILCTEDLETLLVQSTL